MKKTETEDEVNEVRAGTLFVVSTPIGNDDDITLRALKVLKSSDIVVCEEPKVGARMLHKYNLQQKMELLNEQNEYSKTAELVEMLKEGKKLSLVSDCGTPVFADPGLMLVQSAIKNDINVVVVPGPSSIMTGLVRSGFNIDQFLYAGFLSRTKEERIVQLNHLRDEAKTVILLETPYRIMPFLEAAKIIMPDRKAYIGCNLTMSFETHHYGTFIELYEKFSQFKFKGEFVVVFEGATMQDQELPGLNLIEVLTAEIGKKFEKNDGERGGFRRDFGDRRPRTGGFDRDFDRTPRRSSSDSGRSDFNRSRRDDSDRSDFSESRKRSDFSRSREGGFRKDFGDRPPREGGFRKDFGDRPPREGEGFRKDFGDRPPRDDDFKRRGPGRPPREGGFRKDFGDRPPREGGFRKDFGDRPPRDDDFKRRGPGRPPRDGGFRKDFGDRPPREGGFRKDFGDRPPRDDDFKRRGPGRPPKDGGFRKDFGDRPPRDDDFKPRGRSGSGRPDSHNDGPRKPRGSAGRRPR